MSPLKPAKKLYRTRPKNYHLLEKKAKKILNRDTEVATVIEPTEKKGSMKHDWEKFDNIEIGQNCSAELRWFNPSENRKIIAISSFPGSGNTWKGYLMTALKKEIHF